MIEPDSHLKPRYPIESVDNALRLLRVFTNARTVRITEASRELEIARSTVHRLMQMLQYHGFAKKDTDSPAYLAGPTLIELGLAIVRDLDIRTVARPELEALAGQLDETVHLAQLQVTNVLFLDSVEAARALRVGGRIGTVLPAHATSAGKALLARLPPESLRELYRAEELPALTPATTTSRTRLESELVEVRGRGYATNFGGSEADVGAVGVAICDSHGVPRAALSVSIPLSRLTDEDTPRIAAAATEAVRRIEASLP